MKTKSLKLKFLLVSNLYLLIKDTKTDINYYFENELSLKQRYYKFYNYIFQDRMKYTLKDIPPMYFYQTKSTKEIKNVIEALKDNITNIPSQKEYENGNQNPELSTILNLIINSIYA